MRKKLKEEKIRHDNLVKDLRKNSNTTEEDDDENEDYNENLKDIDWGGMQRSVKNKMMQILNEDEDFIAHDKKAKQQQKEYRK